MLEPHTTKVYTGVFLAKYAKTTRFRPQNSNSVVVVVVVLVVVVVVAVVAVAVVVVVVVGHPPTNHLSDILL